LKGLLSRTRRIEELGVVNAVKLKQLCVGDVGVEPLFLKIEKQGGKGLLGKGKSTKAEDKRSTPPVLAKVNKRIGLWHSADCSTREKSGLVKGSRESHTGVLKFISVSRKEEISGISKRN